MADLVTRLKLDSSEHNRGMQDATQKVQQYSGKVNEASGSLNKLQSNTTRSTKELLAQMNGLESGKRSMSNYRQQLTQLTREIADLTVNYRAMSKEQQNGVFGQEVAAKIQDLSSKAAEYKDTIMDVQAQLTAMASDTAGWDSAKQGIDILSSSLQTFVGLGVLGEDSTAALTKAIANMKTIEAALNTVIKVGNALQQQSALMLGVKKVQIMAATAAQKLQTKATVEATAAQKVFNVIANANPYVLLATAIVTVVGALVAFSNGTLSASKEQKKLNEMMKDAVDITDELNTNTSKEISNTIEEATKIKILHDMVQNNNIALAERKKALDELQKMVPDYHGNLTEEGVLINDNTDALDKYITNLQEAARAQAAFNAAVTAYQKAAELQSQYNQLSDKEKGKKKGRKAQEQINQYNAQGDALTEQVANMRGTTQALTTPTKTSSSSSSTKTSTKTQVSTPTKEDEKALEGSVKWLKDMISETQKLRDMQVTGSEAWNEQNEKLQELNKSLESANMMEKALNGTLIDISNIEIEEPMIEFEDVVIDTEDHLVEYVNILKQAKAASENLASVKFDTIQESLSMVQQVSNAVSSAVDTISDPDVSVWEKFLAVLGLINTGMSVFNSIQAMATTLTTANTAAKKANAVASGVEAAAAGTDATAQAALGISKGVQSVSGIPIVGVALGIAAAVAIAAALMAATSKTKFASGGIVPGNSFSGDHVIAGLNSGEMVLNQGQQARLFNMINNGVSGSINGGEVSFKIKGSELVGVLNNYNKKISR